MSDWLIFNPWRACDVCEQPKLCKADGRTCADTATMTPPMNPHQKPQEDVVGLIAKLRALIADATSTPWQVQDGCSWRRIGTREHDGDVLCPTNHHRDGHPDLSAADGRRDDNLKLIVEAVNSLPVLMNAVEQAYEAGRRDMREAAAKAAESLKREVPYDYNGHPCFITMRRAANAIRALPTEPLGGDD